MSNPRLDPKLIITLKPDNTIDEPLYIYKDYEYNAYYFHLEDSSAIVSPKAFNEFVEKLQEFKNAQEKR